MAKYLKQNNSTANAKALERAKRSIAWQAGLAGVTVILTVVIIFAMTSAWYTNIVQTSGLTFQAESWGFDGSVTVDAQSIQAAPGDEGSIYLEAVNSSDSISSVSVGVSKAQIEDVEMQKRLFVYVDTQTVRNGETMDRVYLNTQESYTYTLFSQGKLTLTEDTHSDAPLKWQWVYDMLGYYVLGAWSEDGTRFVEAEYLRPIEYDYDAATYEITKDEDGVVTAEMKTVDGETTMEEFLVALSRTDGYEGVIESDQGKNGYYPVDVDENGYGIYAYLCSYTDIELATQYDTKLGEAAAKFEAGEEGAVEPDTYPVYLTISAQKDDENILPVSTLAALNTAMDLDANCTVQLTADISLTESTTLTIPTGTDLVLDLNGNSIVSSNPDKAISVAPGASLTMLNGTVAAAEGVEAKYGAYAIGGEVTMSNVDISGFDYSVYIHDVANENTLDSKVRLVDCEISGDLAAVCVTGNGSASEQDTQVVIEKCTLTGTYYALVGSGSVAGNGRWGTDVQVIESKLACSPDSGAAVYHPQKDSSLTLYKCLLEGHTGMVIKGGAVTVNGTQIIATAEQKQEAEFVGSGFVPTGDAIFVETSYEYNISLVVKGDTVLQSKAGYPLQVFEEDQDFVSITVYSGTIISPLSLIPEKYIAEGSTYDANNTLTAATAE